MAYSVNQETLVATYNGKEFAPICTSDGHRGSFVTLKLLSFKQGH